MDEHAFIRKLEEKAYYAVVRALAASNKLNFDTETLLLDLQGALGLDDETCINMVSQTETDEEVTTLKAYDVSAPKAAVASQSLPLPSLPTNKHGSARGAQQTYVQEPAMGQPNKKQKKSAGGSLPPPANLGRAPSASPSIKPTPPSAKQLKARPSTGTPQPSSSLPAKDLIPSSSLMAQRSSSKPSGKPTISSAAFSRVMQRQQPEEMEVYLNELNARERDIFTRLIALGVDENDPTLNECHLELLRWYRLDQRQAELSQLLAMT